MASLMMARVDGVSERKRARPREYSATRRVPNNTDVCLRRAVCSPAPGDAVGSETDAFATEADSTRLGRSGVSGIHLLSQKCISLRENCPSKMRLFSRLEEYRGRGIGGGHVMCVNKTVTLRRTNRRHKVRNHVTLGQDV
ncbi:unnamed protein product [Protopolystoma xenopodis]|uniref:Uncharacterized protein n=1 Tax=Protopolystoma xenopodis TaxID=117903 RepID=A0A3S5AN84_9PLAT|nr:unnamed protein product [Protopolystoma xenopodis]